MPLDAQGNTIWLSGQTPPYTGCVVYGERQRPMPTLVRASGGLLGTLVTSVNTVLAPLSGFLPTEPAAGASFSLIAVKTSAGT